MNQIFEGIQSHLSYLELALQTAEAMFRATKSNEVETVSNLADNFERLLNIISHTQKSIEQQIYILDPKEVRMDHLEILRMWVQEVNLLTEKINRVDEETLENLGQLKDQTGAEIASVFANKEKIRGYAFNSVKK